MANIQYLKDTTRSSLIKITDSGISSPAPVTIEAKKLYGALNTINELLYPNGASSASVGTPFSHYNVSFYRAWYDISASTNGYLSIKWVQNNTPILSVAWSGEYNTEGNWGTIINPNAMPNGDIQINTVNVVAYTIFIELVKDNEHYNSGELNTPSAFNYKAFSITP